MTAHSMNPVQCTIISDDKLTLREGGALSDLAPTCLELLDVKQPAEMDGKSLLA